MVAQKRGRGARGQAMKTRAAQPAEDVPADQSETAEPMEAAEGNGDAADQTEMSEDALLESDTEGAEEKTVEDGAPAAEGAEASATEATEEPKEEKVEPGKILVENLPSSFLFDYQEKLKELFSKHGEVNNVRRGPIIVTELTTTPTLSAIVEFKNKESLEKAVTEDGTELGGNRIAVCVEARADAVLVGVPHEAGTDYVRALFAECGDVLQIHEFSKAKYKILRVTFNNKECVDKALKLDRELRINGFLVTVSKYRDDEEQKAHSAGSKRQHSQNQSRNSSGGGGSSTNNNNRNSFRGGRGGGANFNVRPNFRGGGGRGGRGFNSRGGSFRGGYAPAPNSYMPPAGYMPRPSLATYASYYSNSSS